MKMLNPNATEWTPAAFGTATFATSQSTYSAKAAAAAGGAGVPAGAAATAAAGRSNAPSTQQQQLTIQTTTTTVIQVDTTDSGSLSTPNGLAELASVLSCTTSADLTFEDLLFDNSSRRGSLVGQLDGVEEEHTEEEDEDEEEESAAGANGVAAAASDGDGGVVSNDSDTTTNSSVATTTTAVGGGRAAPPCAADVSAAAIAAAAVAGSNGCSGGCDSDGGSSNRSDGSTVPVRSMPVPMPMRKVDDAEVAAVAKAQRDLLADAPNLESAAATDASQPKLGPHDFEILRVVGQGAFGKVFQVRARATGKVYAMKVMRKEKILQKDHGDYVRAERDLLTAVVHPYIVTMRYSFQTASKLYLVLDFINGGHLFFNLYRQGVFDEDVARLYTAEIVAALSYLHGRGIVHRDLKPENVLLDGDGHIRLTDFGLAKGDMEGDSRTNSFIGTMEYMAPEIIDGSGHGRAVDWWSTGILLYEMLSGVPPFRAKSRNQLQQQITTAKPKYPKFLSSNALSLLKALLIRDPKQRLGSGPEGAAAIKKHAFFKGIDWKKLEARELQSKFKPGVKCNMSVENFDKIWTEQRPIDSPCGTPTDPAAADAFAGFTYVAPSFINSSMAALALKRGGDSAAA